MLLNQQLDPPKFHAGESMASLQAHWIDPPNKRRVYMARTLKPSATYSVYIVEGQTATQDSAAYRRSPLPVKVTITI